MEKLIVQPTGPLFGRTHISGSKNAALPILAATLLCRGPSYIGNLPAIRDVEIALSLLSDMGAVIERLDGHTYKIDTTNAALPPTPSPLSSCMRASAYFLGAGLGRFGEGCIGHIGGCDFGTRPIDQHMKAFFALGAHAVEDACGIRVSAGHLRGATVIFDTVSVGATVNAILAAVRAEGETVLQNAACEPHIVDLAAYLCACGADIRGAGTPTVRIRGTRELHGCRYTVIPDMIEAGTYLIAAAATRGAVTVCGADGRHLAPLLETLSAMGCEIDVEEARISLFAAAPLRAGNIQTRPYPGFPTDLHPQMAALFATVPGESYVTENVWHHRFRYAEELRKMGADITVRENTACVRHAPFRGAAVTVPDLRAGAALLIAATAAEGESVLHACGFLCRGYEDIVGKFRSLGAVISAV